MNLSFQLGIKWRGLTNIPDTPARALNGVSGRCAVTRQSLLLLVGLVLHILLDVGE